MANEARVRARAGDREADASRRRPRFERSTKCRRPLGLPLRLRSSWRNHIDTGRRRLFQKSIGMSLRA
jgi:hypothetical protein